MTACKVGDLHYCASDCHGCPDCCHSVTGPATQGSSDVYINGMGALRSQQQDEGTHCCCCGPNSWKTLCGTANILINGVPGVKLGDCTQSCGGIGNMISSSMDTKSSF